MEAGNLLHMTVYGSTETNTYYALTDHLGTVTALADENGAIVESYEYDAWGNITVYDENDVEIAQSQYGNRFTFQGREYSWSTGLYNFRARWYDPETGRWLSKDPIGISGGFNQYVFCGNNPVMFVDPWGFCEVESTKIEIFGAGVAATLGAFGSVGVIWDTEGNFGLTFTGEVGVGVEAGLNSALLDLAFGHIPDSTAGSIIEQSGFDETARFHVLTGATTDGLSHDSDAKFSVKPAVGGGVYKTGTAVMPIVGTDAPPPPSNYPMSLGYFNY